MTMQDPIADLLTRVRNAQSAGHQSVEMPYSNLKKEIARVLKEEGFISGFSVAEGVKSSLQIELSYFEGEPVIEKIVRVSRPGLRIYRGSKEVQVVNGGLGVAIVSTNKGVMTDQVARKEGLGGEVLCTVF